MNKIFLYIIVFICGGAVLAIEILGTRIIGPFYGVSIFLWSALISVTLIALSIGYMLGGRIADKKNDYKTLALLIALAGIFTLLIPFVRDYVLKFTEVFGLRTAVLLSSFILFFLPLFFLGMVSPYAVKLKTQTLNEIGTRAGDLYSVSTIGSVLAALLTGYILIPNIGISKLTLSIGIILIATSAFILLVNKRIFIKLISILLILILAITSLYFTPSEKISNNKDLKAIRQSEYAEIRVMDIDEDRYLLIDGGIHTAINKDSKENVLPYVWVIDTVKKLKDYSGDMLLIGLGGGSVLKSFYNDNWDMEVVEIDPVVTEMAKKYFFLPPSFNNIHHMDGREFLKLTDRRYDLIVLDAFGSSAIPFHLTSMESFRLAKTRLNKDGIIVLNIECIGWNDIIVRSVAATLQKVFKNILALPIVEPPDQLGNVILLASDQPFKLTEEIERDYRDPDYRFSANYEMNHAWDNRFIPDIKNANILTDDLNPVDIWSERVNLRARKELHKLLGDSSFLW